GMSVGETDIPGARHVSLMRMGVYPAILNEDAACNVLLDGRLRRVAQPEIVPVARASLGSGILPPVSQRPAFHVVFRAEPDAGSQLQPGAVGRDALLDVGVDGGGDFDIHIAPYLPTIVVPMYRESLVVVLGVHQDRQAELFQIAGAGDLARLMARLGEDRKENSRQYRYDGDNDEQFDQRKTATRGRCPLLCKGCRQRRTD